MNAIIKKRMLIVAAVLAVLILAAGAAAYSAITRPKPFDKETMRIDPAVKTHYFTSIIDKAQEQFSSLYWFRGIHNPFEHGHDVSVIDFYTDIRKDGSSFNINEILMTVQYQQDGFLYTQHFNIRQNSVSTYIDSQSLDGLLVFNDSPTLDTFTDKLDRLDYNYLSSQLPECDGHIIDMLMSSDMLLRSSDGVNRYLAKADGSYIKSTMDEDTPLGMKVPVLMMGAATVSGDTYGGSESVEVYLNN